MSKTEVSLVVAGRVSTGPATYVRGAVHVHNGRVVRVEVGEPITPPGARLVDVGTDLVLPGAVDAHVHCYSHDGEGMAAATTAAAAGGVTTIVEMPFDASGPVNTLERLRAKQEIIPREAVVDVALLGTLAPGGGWREAEALASGVVGYKVSLFDTHPVRFPRIDDAELLDVMAAVTAVGRTLCVHAENNEIVQQLSAVARHEDPLDPLTHVRTRPPVSESLGVLAAMEIAQDRGTALHLCHLSIPRAVRLAEWYRHSGADITLETCPHYLTFTADDMREQGARLKINPPLRDAGAVEGLWRALGDGAVPVVSSDHAPWPLDLKSAPAVLDNASGAPGVETLVAVTLGGAARRDPGLGALFDQAVSAVTRGPAERFGFGDRKGALDPGYDADIMVVRLDDEEVLDESTLHSNAGWSPFAGRRLGARVTHTFSRGELVWDAATGEVAAPGRGEQVTRG